MSKHFLEKLALVGTADMWIVRRGIDRTFPLPKRAGLAKPPFAGFRAKYIQPQRLGGVQFGRPEFCPDK